MKRPGKCVILTGVVLGLLIAGQVALNGPNTGQAWAGSYSAWEALVDIFADAFSSIGALHIAKSEQHFKACKEWCEKDKDCVKCSRTPGCGKDFVQLKGWTGYGKNWYACAVAKNRTAASRLHRERCESWCKLTEGCVKCSRKAGCGEGYDKMKSWTGYGDNWYACKKRPSRAEAGQSHKEACEKWCKEHSNCAKCSTKSGCGSGYKKIKSWTGRGENWYACEKR